MSCIFGSYSNFKHNGKSLDVEDLRSILYQHPPEDAAEFIKISPEKFLEDMDENPMTQRYNLDIEHCLQLYVSLKGIPRYEESLRLRALLKMDIEGFNVDDQTYIDCLSGKRLRTG